MQFLRLTLARPTPRLWWQRGGKRPYRWSIVTGTLPQGIQLDANTGAISGTTSQAGSFPFTARVRDSNSQSDTQDLTLSVVAQNSSGFDGPAELPRVYMQSAMSDTPALGKTIAVNAGDDLQGALNSASCGDTITLQAGATFIGTYTLPSRSCDNNHWIIIRTSASDSSLPLEGTRVTPCYAGVASLPGRPAFHCTQTANVMAKIVMSGAGSGPIQFAPGANHYRLLGPEITRAVGGPIVYNLSSVQSGSVDHIVFDRVWMHGTALDETNRGIALGGSTYVAVVDSFFADFHCISVSGACTDAQAINGGLGDLPMGPYKIVNNFLEAAAQGVLFGGGPATLTPTDIEIRRNHFFKPMTWMKGQSGYVGGANGNPFIVKNHFELKNAQRVLFEGNIMENTWGGFSQMGFSILLTAKNQNGQCSACQVTDVTIRYSTASHAGAGLQIANGASDSGAYAQAGERFSIHDIIVDDINPVAYAGSGVFAQVSMGIGAPILQSVAFNHVTGFGTNNLLITGNGGPGPQLGTFNFDNGIVNATTYPVWSTGGTGNCAAPDVPLTTFNACFTSYSFVANAVIAPSKNYPQNSWPSGNFFPGDAAAVQFVNYNNGNGGDYHLQPGSPYKNAGNDGKDLGGDVDAVNAAIAGVY